MCSCVRTTDMLPHFQDTCTQKHDINHGRENKIMKKRRMKGETVVGQWLVQKLTPLTSSASESR